MKIRSKVVYEITVHLDVDDEFTDSESQDRIAECAVRSVIGGSPSGCILAYRRTTSATTDGVVLFSGLDLPGGMKACDFVFANEETTITHEVMA